MAVVYKYPICTGVPTRIDIPAGATVLHFAHQHGVFCLWALVDLNSPPEPRTFVVVGTGHQIDFPGGRPVHRGTVLMVGEPLVFHLFELVTSDY